MKAKSTITITEEQITDYHFFKTSKGRLNLVTKKEVLPGHYIQVQDLTVRVTQIVGMENSKYHDKNIFYELKYA